jgi:hypothetical protein
VEEKTASEQIDAIINNLDDWRGEILLALRAVILSTASDIVEEVKWKKPSRPGGVPVWSHNGNLCIGEALKNAVRLTFPKGARIQDPQHAFNTRLDSNTVRAIDYRQDEPIDKAALKRLILEAIELNGGRIG